MAREDIRRMVTETLTRFETDYRNPAKVLEHVHDSVDWWIAGASVMSGKKTKADLVAMLVALPSISDTGMRITPKSFIIEGDRAAVEGDSYLKLKNGKVYANQYHWLFEFRDNKIVKAKEYLDTAHMLEIFGGG